MNTVVFEFLQDGDAWEVRYERDTRVARISRRRNSRASWTPVVVCRWGGDRLGLLKTLPGSGADLSEIRRAVRRAEECLRTSLKELS